MADFWGDHLSEKLTDMSKQARKLNTDVIRAINEQTVQLRSALLEASRASVNSSVILAPTSKVSANTDQAPTRPHGYVNWNSTHDVIKAQNWKRVSEFMKYCSAGELQNEAYMRTYMRAPMERLLKDAKLDVDEKTRFPQIPDVCEVFFDVSDSVVCTEILYIQYVQKPALGLLEHLLTTMKDHMHTRSSFEEKYKLKWVEPPKEQP